MTNGPYSNKFFTDCLKTLIAVKIDTRDLKCLQYESIFHGLLFISPCFELRNELFVFLETC